MNGLSVSPRGIHCLPAPASHMTCQGAIADDGITATAPIDSAPLADADILSGEPLCIIMQVVRPNVELTWGIRPGSRRC